MQTSGYADADAKADANGDGIRTKNNMPPPPPMVGGHNDLIGLLCPWCICPVYIVTIVQVSNCYLENWRRSCGDTNSTIKCDGETHR